MHRAAAEALLKARMAISTSETRSLEAELQRLLLAWDYWELAERIDSGAGAGKDVKPVPATFASEQVVSRCAEQLSSAQQQEVHHRV